MRTISYEEYFDRVYGCFLGKCIGGTAGGPAEGRKELLDYPLNEDLLHITLPNDDLDLQILWLELLEDQGIYITARDMGREFHDKVPYGPGEYGYFKKSFGRGVYPPLTGTYNNRYYKNGMGCPIRAEIWACLFPGAPELTRHYVDMDGSLDHEHDSIEAEYFLASLESEAFFIQDIRVLLKNAIARLKPDTKITNVLKDTIRWYDEGHDWQFTRGMILRHYGHSDCTNLYQNMGFILLTLLYGQGDFRETIRLGMACGYDTDCICASAASILGILRGAKKMLGEDGLTDTGLKIAIHTRRQECSIADLTKDVCAAGMTMADVFEGAAAITERPDFTPIPTTDCRPAYTLAVEYEGDPVLLYGETSKVTLCITNRTEKAAALKAEIAAPEGICASLSEISLTLEAGESIRLPMTVRVADGAKTLAQKNLFRVTISDGAETITDTFGIIGGDVWYHYGPFLMNNQDISHVPPHEFYGQYLKINEGENATDVIRDYHLNTFADINREFVSEALPFTAIPSDGRAECIPERICLKEDLFDLAEIQGYEGPHTDYLVRYFASPEEREIEIAVGHTAPFKLWLNGAYVGGSDDSTWWTCENKHLPVHIQKGENVLILKCAQVSDHAKYSVIPRMPDNSFNQWEDFVSVIKEEI